MKVLKFGGSSLADAACFNHVAEIINLYGQKTDVATVLSAPKGITNDLIALTDNLLQINDDQFQAQLAELEQKLRAILDTAFNLCPDINRDGLNKDFTDLLQRLNKLYGQKSDLTNLQSETSFPRSSFLPENISAWHRILPRLQSNHKPNLTRY